MLAKRHLHALMTLALGHAAELDAVSVTHLQSLKYVIQQNGIFKVTPKGHQCVDRAMSACNQKEIA